jgi:hypothetical protein
MSKEYTIGVWDCTFYLTDNDGNEVLDENGFVQIYDAPDLDYSYIAEHPEIDDLVKVKEEKDG